jgi:hypothetical protein
MMCNIARLGLAAVAVMFFAPSAFAQVALSSAYWDTNLSFNRCMEHTERVLGELNFTQVTRATTAFFGYYGDYSAQVICLTAKSTTIVIVAGPDSKTAGQHLQDISQKLNAAK